MRKGHLAASVLAAWTIVVTGFMLLARTLDLEVFFVLWLIGTLVVTELSADHFATPRHVQFQNLVIAAGIVLFGAIVARKVMEILAR